ncbi:hypothetical protein F5Y16DRAFT_415343 [Xylariaceae sp. FL0255]|nr:hypothetical protein F5Y16DRAFT_415343 [Xylariaceae sp. FL0255]
MPYLYYAVHKGRKSGVYTCWDDCQEQVHAFRGARHKGFNDRTDAQYCAETGQGTQSDSQRAAFESWKRAKLGSSQPPPLTPRPVLEPVVSKPKYPNSGLKSEPLDASQSYFAQVPNFEPDTKAGFDDEFQRFASSQQIPRGNELGFLYSQPIAIDKDGEKNAVKQEESRGLDPSDKNYKLIIYQNMCRQADLEPLDTIEGCLAILKSVLVNIIDYLDAKRSGEKVKVWPPDEFEEFARYTLWGGKSINMQRAKEGDGTVAALLQNLTHPDARELYQENRKAAEVARQDCARRRAKRRASKQQPQSRLSVVSALFKEEGPTEVQTDTHIKQEVGATEQFEIKSDFERQLEMSATFAILGDMKSDLDQRVKIKTEFETQSTPNSECSNYNMTPGHSSPSTKSDMSFKASPSSPATSIASFGPDKLSPSHQKDAKRKFIKQVEGVSPSTAKNAKRLRTADC